jgi:hypothetical protein
MEKGPSGKALQRQSRMVRFDAPGQSGKAVAKGAANREML